MATVIRWQDKTRFEVQARSHSIVSDQPREDGGDDLGPEPLELLDAALGTCIGVYLSRNLEQAGFDRQGLTVEVRREMIKEHPHRVGAFRVEVRIPVEVDERRRKALLRAARGCTIHHTFEHAPEIDIQLTTGR